MPLAKKLTIGQINQPRPLVTDPLQVLGVGELVLFVMPLTIATATGGEGLLYWPELKSYTMYCALVALVGS